MTKPKTRHTELAERMVRAALAFQGPIRTGRGYSQKRFEALEGLLQQCAEAWAESDEIPRLAADLFVDFQSWVASSARYYDETTAAKIRNAATVLTVLVRQCVATKVEFDEDQDESDEDDFE